MIRASFYMFNEDIQNMRVGNEPSRNLTRLLCVTFWSSIPRMQVCGFYASRISASLTMLWHHCIDLRVGIVLWWAPLPTQAHLPTITNTSSFLIEIQPGTQTLAVSWHKVFVWCPLCQLHAKHSSSLTKQGLGRPIGISLPVLPLKIAFWGELCWLQNVLCVRGFVN